MFDLSAPHRLSFIWRIWACFLLSTSSLESKAHVRVVSRYLYNCESCQSLGYLYLPMAWARPPGERKSPIKKFPYEEGRKMEVRNGREYVRGKEPREAPATAATSIAVALPLVRQQTIHWRAMLPKTPSLASNIKHHRATK